MTIEDVRYLVEAARAGDPARLEAKGITTVIAVLRDRVTNLYDETQRESARWLAATADRPLKSLLELSLPLPLMRGVEKEPTQVRDLTSLIRIARLLLEWGDAMEDVRKHDWARWGSAPADIRRRRVQGGHLICDEDCGRLYLINESIVLEGTSLWLLTSAGWMAGMFHTRHDQPFFKFRLPGDTDNELEIPISARAVLALSLNEQRE